MKSLVTILAVLFIGLGGLALVGQGTVHANALSVICNDYIGPECEEAATGGTIERMVQTVTDILFIIIAAVSVLVLIIAGLMYIVSAGNPETTKRAKNAILYALVGLVVAFFAQAIVRIILGLV